jgi:heme a synthase
MAAMSAAAAPLPPAASARPLAVANWLLGLCALIFLMVIVGGITRLTESGLSITEWKPISGAIPPLTEAQWLHEFELYKRIPEYQQINRGMSLDEFKFIYFWEWFHRQLGRVIGLAALVPLAWFLAKKSIPQGYRLRTASIFLLICVQGAIGWWMVASGLTARTDVSHLRLAVHLLVALAIFGWALWIALDLRSPGAERQKVPTLALWAFALLGVQLLFGAYVAGLNAGYAFNSWPLMGDELYPAAAPWLEPALRNLVDNPVTVQFIHRWLAFGVLGIAILLALRVKKAGGRRESLLLHAAVGIQILLGIWTLVSGVEFAVAVAHQGMATLVVAAFVLAAHRLAVSEGAGASTKLATNSSSPLAPSEVEGRLPA